MYGRPIRVATRSSALSLSQVREAINLLKTVLSEETFEIVSIDSEGDRHKLAPLSSMERGMFSKRIEQALMEGEVDLAVHSAKDVPSELPDGLLIAGYTKRLDSRDVLVHKSLESLSELPKGFRLGTSSQRRASQILNIRPDISIVPVRGNVDTRMLLPGKGVVDGVVLAASGLIRLGRSNEIACYLSLEESLPDVGQGAVMIQCRDKALQSLLKSAGDMETSVRITAERSFLSEIQGGCSSPAAAYAEIVADEIVLRAMIGTSDGSEVYRSCIRLPADRACESGKSVLEGLVEAGASHLIGSENDKSW